MDSLLFNKDNFIQYLKGFDAVNEKYSINSKYKLHTEAKRIASQYEQSFQYGHLTKSRYSYMLENLQLVYGDSELIHNDIIAYHKTEKNIIHTFLAIPQLDKMFDEDYFNFEWDMHVGQNFNEHRNEYYRDHFIHQIRDMYMMLEMLNKCNLYEAIKDILKDYHKSKISEYFCKKMVAFKADKNSAIINVLNAISEQERIVENILYDSEPDKMQWPSKDSDYIEDYFCNYVIKASIILSGLFHDMGYPICHFLGVRERLSEYNPTLYMFTRNAIDSMDQVSSILSPSLLFSLVSINDIKKSLARSDNGKYDHGAYSAISFLLQFYNNGIIFSLPLEKQCAIELAALAIYNHTAGYCVIKDKKEYPYYSLFFQQNPIAFLLRFCDDLQEWERRYFEISKSSDLMFCAKCGTPLLKREKEKGTNHLKTKETVYNCWCAEDENVERPDIFLKRKLYLVTVTRQITANLNEDEKSLIVDFEYDKYTLLQLCNINYTYAKYRHSELAGIQKIIKNQIFGEKAAFQKIQLDYFMSANPILIKLKILESFLKKNSLFSNSTIAYYSYIRRAGYYLRYSGQRWRLIQRMVGNSNLTTNNIIGQYYDLSFQFYLSLILDCNNINNANKYYENAIEAFRSQNRLYYTTMNILINDCKDQYLRLKNNNQYPDSDNYIKDEEKEEGFYDFVQVYTDSSNDFNRYESIEKSIKDKKEYSYISFFGDMYLFYSMNEETK